ncbi:zinc finger protein [Trichoderma cornu-damae]|uniref:Zinc finger protein n=1 Tax=Trichoderma cornu-damae TaxID=654480 RepID=A0A9P8QNN1_9HYPO|nr:zinc finger protein [Trichoderma cornu-damae]
MAAANSSSLPPFSAACIGNSGRVVYDYDQVPAAYSAAPVSLPDASVRGDHFYEPIDPDLLADSSSSDGSRQYWAVSEVPYFQPSPGDPRLDAGLAGNASSGCVYQGAYGRNGGSQFPFQSSPAFSLIESPSIGSDGHYDMMMDPPTPPDAHGSVASLGSPYDSDCSYGSNVESLEISFYPRPREDDMGGVANPAYYGMGVVALGDQCVFNAAPAGGHFGAADAGARHYALHATLPYVSSVRHIKEESLPPSAEERISSARATRRRVRAPRCHLEPASCKRASPDHEASPPHGDKKRRIHMTNKKFCHKCKKNFPSRTSLEEHTGLEHPRPYVCVFHYAGCTARFDAKNEWKRHVSTKHLGLRYWVCTEGKCADERQSSYQRNAGLPLYGNIFNRKDLYTQHIRRMHATVAGQTTTDYKGADARSDAMVKKMQEDALRIRCKLPTWMPCPVQSCDKSFTGSNAWDERMEHVAQQHFDNAAAGREPPVEFGGSHDMVLTEWASRPDIRIVKRTETGWELCDPLKGDTEYRMASPDGEE